MGATETTDTTNTTDKMDTRERILYETWRLFEKRQRQGLRLEDIAKAAGVSRQAIYLHFGSRAELFIQTARYVDDQLRVVERLQEACEAEGNQPIEAYVSGWASCIPDVYHLAKALLALRDTDEAAAAAWADRMQALYNGCLTTMQTVERDGNLAPGWTVEQAADFLWALLSIETWEDLTIDRGWSKEQYGKRIQLAAKHTLTQQP